MARDPSDRLKIPAVTSKPAIVWGLGTLVAVFAVSAYVYVTQPSNRWAVWAVVGLTALFVVFAATRRCWIETETGTVVWQRFWFSRTRVRLEDASEVEYLAVRNGTLQLALRSPESRRRRLLPLLMLTMYVERSQRPDVLAGLADQIEKWSHAQIYGRLPKELRAQAKHVAAGGGPHDSPLARYVKKDLTAGIAAGGAAGGGAGLFG
jgi:hypothetical protein